MVSSFREKGTLPFEEWGVEPRLHGGRHQKPEGTAQEVNLAPPKRDLGSWVVKGDP